MIMINILPELFAKYGLPDEIISNNVSQFVAGELKRFCEAFTIKYIMTTAYYPRSNCQAERCLQKKSDVNNEEELIQKFL